MPQSYHRTCLICHKTFSTSRSWQKTCSEECRKEHYIKQQNRQGIFPTLASGTTGAIAELAVSTDLLKKEYSVFRALSPSCFCDLIAIKKDQILRVEVRTGYKSNSGKIAFSLITHGEIDCFGIYIPIENEVGYFDLNKKEIKLK